MSIEKQTKIISHSALSRISVLGLALLVAGLILASDLLLKRINVSWVGHNQPVGSG